MLTPGYGLTATERVLPRLALDFTTASLDPRITVTRALNTATRVNSSGYIESINANLPRFDFDPVTKLCSGLLIEETRENLFIQSEDINSATLVNAQVTTDVAGLVAPNGLENADKFYETTANGQHAFERAYASSIGIYTQSGFFKSAERTRVRLNLYSTTLNAVAVFDLANGTIVTQSDTISAFIKDYGNGWYRCTITAEQVDLRTLGVRYALISSGTTHSYVGIAGYGAYGWGLQLEKASFSTSYIPTTTTSVTRNADVASMTGANFSGWWVATNGAATVKYTPSTVVSIRPVIQFDDNTANNIVALRGNTTNPELYIKATTDQAQIDAGTIAANTNYGLSGAWNTNNCAAAINGGAAVTDTSATIPAVTQARLGSDGTNYLNGWLQTVRYWPQRITDAEAQAFSKL